MTEPLDTADLLAFATTVDARSLSRAAAELGVPRTTIGRRLARLEHRLGVRLLRRTTRSLALSDAGEALYRHARIVLDALAQAESSVRRNDGEIRGDIRVSVPPMPGTGFHALVSEFAAQHPAVRIQVHATTQHVDLNRGGYDIALRASTQLEPGLVARTIGRTPTVAVASPTYLARAGTPKTVADLRKHRCLQMFERGELPQSHWPLAAGGRVHVDGAIASNDIQLIFHAARAGLGIALLPLVIVHEPLVRGELVRVLPRLLEMEVRLAIVYAEREFMPPQVRAFVDAMVAWGEREFGASMAALRDDPKCKQARAREPKRSPRTTRSGTPRRR